MSIESIGVHPLDSHSDSIYFPADGGIFILSELAFSGIKNVFTTIKDAAKRANIFL